MHVQAKQKLMAYAAGLAMLGGVSYVGARSLKPDAPLSVEPISGKTPPGGPRPDGDGKPIEAESPRPAETPKTPPAEVVVALAGAVKKAGLYHLPPESRVDDAIKAAGGPGADADLEAINLAAKAVDGDQIYVPRKKAEEPAKATESERVVPKYRGGSISSHIAPLTPDMPAVLGGRIASGDAPHRSGAKPKASGPVSLSTASLAQLETLPGVGPATAQKILDYRQEHGGFASIEEIEAVKGIGPKKFEKMKPFLKR